MLYEFVIEPDLLYEIAKSRRDYSDFITRFSIGSPQVLSDYPNIKNFRKQVFRNQPLEVSHSEQSRLEEIVRFIQEIPRVRRCGAYSGENWLGSVLQENTRASFDHVLTNKPNDGLQTTNCEQLFSGEINYPSQLLVQRVATVMAGAVANMLRLASTIVLVDPYFSDRQTMWQPFYHFVRAALQNRPGAKPSIFVLFGYEKPRTATPVHLTEIARERMPDELRQCSITFVSLKEKTDSERLHNRYILTDIGGVSFGGGLDEQGEHQQDDVILLSEEIYKLRWRQYALMEAFEVASSVST